MRVQKRSSLGNRGCLFGYLGYVGIVNWNEEAFLDLGPWALVLGGLGSWLLLTRSMICSVYFRHRRFTVAYERLGDLGDSEYVFVDTESISRRVVG